MKSPYNDLELGRNTNLAMNYQLRTSFVKEIFPESDHLCFARLNKYKNGTTNRLHALQRDSDGVWQVRGSIRKTSAWQGPFKVTYWSTSFTFQGQAFLPSEAEAEAFLKLVTIGTAHV